MRYVIYFEGIFDRGYVRTSFLDETGIYKVPTLEDSLSLATKYRFKWYAQIICYIFNRVDKRGAIYCVHSV